MHALFDYVETNSKDEVGHLVQSVTGTGTSESSTTKAFDNLIIDSTAPSNITDLNALIRAFFDYAETFTEIEPVRVIHSLTGKGSSASSTEKQDRIISYGVHMQ